VGGQWRTWVSEVVCVTEICYPVVQMALAFSSERVEGGRGASLRDVLAFTDAVHEITLLVIGTWITDVGYAAIVFTVTC
jgi:hypothetical protein